MNEMRCFQTPCLRILKPTSIEIVQSHFKLWHQVASTTTSTSFLTPPPPPCGHPLPPLSALANAHLWANPGQACQHQQSPAPPHHHLSAAAPMLPAPATTWRTTTTSWDGWRRVRRVGRKGKGDLEGDDDAVCNPHAVSSYFFSSVLFDDAVCNPHAMSSFFSSVLFDDAACNPHAVSSISFPRYCLTTRRATHTPRRLFLFLSVVWRWHAVSSISFPQCCLMTQRATHTPCCLFLFLSVVWWRGVQPTCRVVYFFPQCCLTTRCATHMPRRLFLSSMLLDDAACNPHAVLSISFTPSCLFLSFHVVWWHSMQPTCHASGKGHLALAVFRCFSWPRASWDILGCLRMSQDALGQLKHLKTARAGWPFPDVLSIYFYFYFYILLDFIRSVLEYNL